MICLVCMWSVVTISDEYILVSHHCAMIYYQYSSVF